MPLTNTPTPPPTPLPSPPPLIPIPPGIPTLSAHASLLWLPPTAPRPSHALTSHAIFTATATPDRPAWHPTGSQPNTPLEFAKGIPLAKEELQARVLPLRQVVAKYNVVVVKEKTEEEKEREAEQRSRGDVFLKLL
ncbi:hypothetical protein P153DRAFT_390256 [Dothidotthia symphoricarpi CBS 119687]|uniref:Uncharacterized protein n=1 Tax=Dothidotthia symphoricarpi CBS 119687 TaxID=1392245 RepID=A0A6A6A1F6_9PLEO|nr:uncharacterized protein P153DRAFT_390256 [Dothidotthia symphoricarpi CBS 119687]KAF2124787.1 hypothetical protein P153DRAFT_390256 [Dothidotthia symphoricarpi CBS 119687]